MAYSSSIVSYMVCHANAQVKDLTTKRLALQRQEADCQQQEDLHMAEAAKLHLKIE